MPELLMVPRAVEPPEMELTDQVTGVLEVPETEAEKESEEPARMLAAEGVTVTVMDCGGGNVVVVREDVPQADRHENSGKRAKKEKMRAGE